MEQIKGMSQFPVLVGGFNFEDIPTPCFLYKLKIQESCFNGKLGEDPLQNYLNKN